MAFTEDQKIRMGEWAARALELADPSKLSPSRYIENYKGTAAYLCVWVPPEVFRAGGYHPFLLRGRKPEVADAADSCLHCVALDEGFRSGLPAPDLKLIAVPDTCRSLVNSALRIASNHNLGVFHFEDPKTQTDESLRRYLLQISLMKDLVNSHGASSENYFERLEEAFRLYTRLRSLLSKLRASERIPNSLYYLLLSAAQTSPPEEVIPLLEEVLTQSATMPEATGKRLMLVGGILGANEWELAADIEAVGGFLVTDLLCRGGRYEAVGSGMEDLPILERIAVEYFNRLPCMPHQPNERFYNMIRKLLEEKDIRGIVFMKPANCSAYSDEEERLRWYSMVPLLSISSEFAFLDAGERRRMLGGFLEEIN
ncbi:MAG: hypothetical protein Kow00107_02280 [Planctomycetota bacterium]